MPKKFVNIFFRTRDAELSDLDILRTMRDLISNGRASVTDYSVMEKQGGCFSIQMDGIFEDRCDVYDKADRQVYLWIRHLPTRGLPFDRRAVFRYKP